MSRFLKKLLKLWNLLARQEYRSALRHRVAAAIEHEALVRSLNAASIVDVGANVGQFSLVALALRPNVVVHAFEPLPRAATRFEAVFKHAPNVRLHRCALGALETELTIHVSASDDSSSLLPISRIQTSAFPGTQQVEEQAVQVRRGDDVLGTEVLPSPLLIKLDVQGYELEVLKGMPQLLGRSQYVYAELSFLPFYEGQPLAPEVIGWLQGNGFKLASIHTVGRLRNGLGAQVDALFVADGCASPLLARSATPAVK
jgi:FkbM family methyltransferase